jgi:hypothetical protein
LITPEQLEQEKTADTAKVEKEKAITGLVDASDIVVRINTTQVRSKRGVNFAAGGCFGLYDPQGKEGALYRAKDELKSQYGAKFFNGWREDSEFPGGWWLISTRYDQEEILKVVAKY